MELFLVVDEIGRLDTLNLTYGLIPLHGYTYDEPSLRSWAQRSYEIPAETPMDQLVARLDAYGWTVLHRMTSGSATPPGKVFVNGSKA